MLGFRLAALWFGAALAAYAVAEAPRQLRPGAADAPPPPPLAAGAAAPGAAKGAPRVSFVHPPSVPEQALRVCNAFAFPEPLDVIQERGEVKLTTSGPLKYKDCRDLTPKLVDGDRLRFEAGGQAIGDFAVASLPRTPSLLLLVAHRRAGAVALAFKSHAFAADASDAGRVAVIDTYHGANSDKSSILITERRTNASEAMQETLEYNSVVDLTPGAYDLQRTSARVPDGPASAGMLAEASNLGAKPAQIDVAGGTSYVVLRVGETQPRQGPSGAASLASASYEEELVVFPRSLARGHAGVGGLAAALAVLAACSRTH